MENFSQSGVGNIINIPGDMKITGRVRGSRNQVVIESGSPVSNLHLEISGNDNKVFIGRGHMIKGLKVIVGSHVPAHETSLIIGRSFSVEANARFFLYNSGNSLRFGDACMLSNSITVRCGELPHLLFDSITGEYLDQSNGVAFGNHVWIGENVYVTKSGGANDDTIIGACSVLTKKFTETYVALAGNPARIVRENIKWVRNHTMLQEGSKEHLSLQQFHSRFQRDDS